MKAFSWQQSSWRFLSELVLYLSLSPSLSQLAATHTPFSWVCHFSRFSVGLGSAYLMCSGSELVSGTGLKIFSLNQLNWRAEEAWIDETLAPSCFVVFCREVSGSVRCPVCLARSTQMLEGTWQKQCRILMTWDEKVLNTHNSVKVVISNFVWQRRMEPSMVFYDN